MSEFVQWPPPPGAAGIVLGEKGSLVLLGLRLTTGWTSFGNPRKTDG